MDRMGRLWRETGLVAILFLCLLQRSSSKFGASSLFKRIACFFNWELTLIIFNLRAVQRAMKVLWYRYQVKDKRENHDEECRMVQTPPH